MATLPVYEEWIVELEQDRAPTDLTHIGVSIGDKARFLAREIPSFEWPAAEHAQAKELAKRARAVGRRTLDEDMRRYYERGPA